MKVKVYFTRTAVFIKEIELPDGSDLSDLWLHEGDVFEELERRGLSLDGEPENGYLDDVEIDHIEEITAYLHERAAAAYDSGKSARDFAAIFTKQELETLAQRCRITPDNPHGEAYDDEVFDALAVYA